MPKRLDSPATILYEAMASAGSAKDLPELLERVVDATLAMTDAEHGFVVLRGEGGLDFWAARHMERADIQLPAYAVSRTLVERALADGQTVYMKDARREMPVPTSSVERIGVRSVLVVPFRLSDAVAGVAYLDHHRASGVFDEDARSLVERFAAGLPRVMAEALAKEQRRASD